jgi:hypothetical protein
MDVIMLNARRHGVSRFSSADAIVHMSLITMSLMLSVVSSVRAQPCNPIVDGTYCAEQMPRNRAPAPTPPSSGFATPMRSIGADLSLGPGYLEQPATIGAVTFRGNNESCVGLLLRGRCN